jgi:hypothetical protein
MLSKSEALRREIAGGSPYREGYDLALTARCQGSASSAGEFKARLLPLYRDIVPPAHEEINGYLARAIAC